MYIVCPYIPQAERARAVTKASFDPTWLALAELGGKWEDGYVIA